MSVRATRESILLLGIINGVLISFDKNGLLEDLAPTIKYGMSLCDRVLQALPGNDRRATDLRPCQDVMRKVSLALNREGEFFPTPVLVHIGQTLCVDLLEEVTDPEKRELLGEIQELMDAISDAVDPYGDNYAAYEEADQSLKTIYEIVGFQKNGAYLKQQKKLQRRRARYVDNRRELQNKP